MNFFQKLFKIQPKETIKPEDFGWVKTYNNHYTKNNYVLYKSMTGWVLDKHPKNAPGIINKFGKELTDIDMEEANNFAEHIENPTRLPSSYFSR